MEHHQVSQLLAVHDSYGVKYSFEFDCRNRLVKAGDTTYEYDAENNRTAVTTGTKRTEYVVNSQPELGQVLQSTVTDGDNTKTTYYYYGQGLLAQENSKGYLMYHFNNVGSAMAVTDKDGVITAKYNYSPYGELIEGEYDENIQFLYNGQYGVTTDGNGLYYMRARYYNVDIKRFINQDVLTGTLERISSLNRYSYVEGNPVSYLDPFGLETARFNAVVNDLHDLIAETQLIILIAQIALAATAVVATATAQYAVTVSATAAYANFQIASTMLAGVDTTLYSMQALNPNDTNDARREAAFMGALSLLSILSPIKKIVKGNITLSDIKKVKDIMGNFLWWIGSEAASLFWDGINPDD